MESQRQLERYEETEYLERLRAHLLLVLGKKPATLCEIACLAGGAFPITVSEVLSRLVSDGAILENRGAHRSKEYRLKEWNHEIKYAHVTPAGLYEGHLESEAEISSPSFLRAAHPADFDWRFTRTCLARLKRMFDMETHSREKIALFGTPTLYPVLLGCRENVSLFDKSGVLISDLRKAGYSKGLIRHDLAQPIPKNYGSFDIVVADPPWYLDFYKSFFARASEVLRNEGTLFLSVLPWLTRPSAIEDRAELIGIAKSASFDLASILPAFLNYVVPPFEDTTLRAQGIKCADWRSGDLYVFRRTNRKTTYSAEDIEVIEPPWHEFQIGYRTVKLRGREDKIKKRFSFRPLGKAGSVLDTVSRTSPVRLAIDLWTSNNEAFSVQGLEILKKGLALLENEKSLEPLAEELTLQFRLSAVERKNLHDMFSILTN